MKVRNFRDSGSPAGVVDPRSGYHITPPLTASASARKPVGHAERARAPEEVGDTELPPPPAGPLPASFGAELEQACSTILPALRGLAAPNERERLTGVTCAVLNSESAMACILAQRNSDEERREGAGVAGVDGRIPVSSYVVGFADDLLRRIDLIVSDREAVTQADRDEPTNPEADGAALS